MNAWVVALVVASTPADPAAVWRAAAEACDAHRQVLVQTSSKAVGEAASLRLTVQSRQGALTAAERRAQAALDLAAVRKDERDAERSARRWSDVKAVVLEVVVVIGAVAVAAAAVAAN